MKAAKTTWVCRECGRSEPRWQGRCLACNAWDSLEERDASLLAARSPTSRPSGTLGDGRPTPRPLSALAAESTPRLPTGLAELDRVLGGGFVAGSLVLLGGEPGIGKSTLLLQALDGLARRAPAGRSVLYVSAEESVAQTALRAQRLGLGADGLLVVAEAAIEPVIETAERTAPFALAIDSIQTVYSGGADGVPGSVAQVRECAGRLLAYAKGAGVPTILVGHVTKEGSLAGPKTLEHLVDAVLHFEGDGAHSYRLLRATKNRFGSTAELGVFDMRGTGLVEIADPSALLLAERPVGAPGSVVVASAEASRPLCVEVQALVGAERSTTPRRTSVGLDPNRVAMLIAVLERHAGASFAGRDVFVNVAGGIRLAEPAADLAVVAALASSLSGRPVDGVTVVFGEFALSGEVRAVGGVERRLAEVRKLGFGRCVAPPNPPDAGRRLQAESGLVLIEARSVREALTALGL